MTSPRFFGATTEAQEQPSTAAFVVKGGKGLVSTATASKRLVGVGSGTAGKVGGALAAVPVAGWIAAGGLAAAAGTVALVRGIRKGKVNRRAAVAEAKKLGLPDADKVPGFAAKAIRLAKKNPEKLARLGEKIERKVRRKRKTKRVGRKERRLRAKLALIGAVLKLRLDEAQGHEAPPHDAALAEVDDAAVSLDDSDAVGGLPSWALPAAGVAAVLLVVLISMRRP